MRPAISHVLVVVLVFFCTFVSCNRQESVNKKAHLFVSPRGDYDCDLLNDSVNEKARRFVSPKGDYTCDLLNDTIDFSAFIPFLSYEGNELESLCANPWGQYVVYTGSNPTVREFACYYNTLIAYHNLNSDIETAARFGEDDEDIAEYDDDIYQSMADSIMSLGNLINSDLTIINNDYCRKLLTDVIEQAADYVRHKEKNYDKVEEAYSDLFNYLNEKLNPIIEATRDEYMSYMTYLDDKGCYGTLDSVMEKRGKSDRAYQQKLLTKLYFAPTPVERHIYAIEFAHSDAANASFLAGAVVLHQEMVESGKYSPYLYDMWRTWRAVCSTRFGPSSWSYIPDLHYNRERKQVADIVISHIENNPIDTLALGLLLNLAACENIARHGSIVGNGSLNEQMYMFPEWKEKISGNKQLR